MGSSTNGAMSGGLGAIEMLMFRPSSIPAFLQADEETWTPFLEQQPGFDWKLLLTNCPNNVCADSTFDGQNATNLVVEIIHWRSREQWKSIPEIEQLKVVAAFNRRYSSI